MTQYLPPDHLHCRQRLGNVESHGRHPEEESDEGVMDEVADYLAGEGAQECVGVVGAQLKVVGYAEHKVAEEHIQQESDCDLGEESLSDGSNCQVEDQG